MNSDIIILKVLFTDHVLTYYYIMFSMEKIIVFRNILKT